MERKAYTLNDESLPDDLIQTLNQIAAKANDRKDEVVNVLSNEQPSKSRWVEEVYVSCTWWEGCYYCQDEQNNWHRVKCFA